MVGVYDVRVRGSALRPVVCEECGAAYGYALEREAAHGSFVFLGLDWEVRRIEMQARRALEQKLKCEVAPCPACGWVQGDMVALAKSRHLRWLPFVSAPFLCLAIFIGIFNAVGSLGVPWAWIAAVAAFGLGILGLHRALVSMHDPNGAPVGKRLALAKKRSLTQEEFDRLVKAAEQQPPPKRR